ncbi:MAG TPA: hypothetical protein VF395_10290 [Polyangiaceae bacterium]
MPSTSQMTCSAGSRRFRSVAVLVTASASSIHLGSRLLWNVSNEAGAGSPASSSSAEPRNDTGISYGMVMGRITKELPPEFANVAAYLDRLKERPAYTKAWA